MSLNCRNQIGEMNYLHLIMGCCVECQVDIERSIGSFFTETFAIILDYGWEFIHNYSVIIVFQLQLTTTNHEII